MRKFILSIMAVLCFTAFGQKATAQVITLNGSHATTDTVTNTGTTDLTTAAGVLTKMTNGKYRVAFKITNVSGTSSLRAIVQGSLDGQNWVNYFGNAGTNGVQCDTLTITSAAPAYHIWALNQTNDSKSNWGRVLFLRVRCIGTATQSTIVEARLIPQD